MPGRVTATPAVPRLPVSVGETIAAKYAVESVIGAGGMGVVVRARHLVLGSQVALKFMLPEIASDPEMRTRFSGEALRVAQMQSEHVARVLDVGELPTGIPYIVMEYAEGRDLSSLLKERGALPPSETVDYVLQACEAIAEAHSRGIVHRDIKPANLFVARRVDGTALVKVLDFGIAKTLPGIGGSSDKLTKTYTTMGSPYYSAPEQLESASFADPRSDIWALGVTLHELLTAQGPFEGGSQASLITAIMTRPPFPLRHVRPDLPEDLEWVIGRCLEKDPNRRFRRVVDLAECLVAHGTADAAASLSRIAGIPGQDRRSTVAVASSGAPAPMATPSPRPASARPPMAPTVGFASSPPPNAPAAPLPTRPLRAKRSSRWVIFAFVGTVALLSAAIAAFVWLRPSPAPPPLPPPPSAVAPPPVVLQPPGPKVTPR